MQAGHTVTAFTRDREKLFSRLAVQPGLIVKIGDVTNETLLSEAMAGQDAVINAAGNASDGPIFVTLVQTVIAAAERALAPGGRLWLFGGAGVLTVPGTTLLGVDLPGFPAIYQAHRKNYDAVRATRLDWSMLCPGPMIAAPDGRAHDGLSLSADTLPFPSRRWARLLPRIVHTVTFAARLKEIAITYEDAAKVILDYLAPSGAFSRKRVGVALPPGMKLPKPRGAAGDA
jgi:putative NADH-flavin reductase